MQLQVLLKTVLWLFLKFYWTNQILVSSFIHSVAAVSAGYFCIKRILYCIMSGYFYSASSSPLLPRGAPDTARILCRSFTPKRHRQLRVKELPKVRTWRLERDSNPRPSGRQLSTLPMSHLVPQCYFHVVSITMAISVVACNGTPGPSLWYI